MSLIVLTFTLFMLGCEGAQKCLNDYRQGNVIFKYGRPASVKPDRDVYYPDDVVRFRCPAGYRFQSSYYRRHKEMWIKCLKQHRWLEDWPICRGPLENVTCENRYNTAETHGRHWLNQTVNEFHAIFHPKLPSYQYGKTLRFSCPTHTHLFNTKGLTAMITTCLKDGEWSREWPMCKGKTCKYKYVKNGIINDKNKKLSVGVKLDILCEPDHFLWGPNQTTCLSTLEWSGYPQECVTLEKFRLNCEMDKRVMKIRNEGLRQIPYCYYKHIERGSNHYKIAVGISVPMAIGFIIFIVTASFYVRHQRIKMARERAAYIRHQHQQNRMLSSLPSYEDAIKSKPNVPPPTFEETFGTDMVSTENNLLLQSEDPPSNYRETDIDLPPQYNETSTIDSPPEYVETYPSIHSPNLGASSDYTGNVSSHSSENSVKLNEQLDSREDEVDEICSPLVSDHIVNNVHPMPSSSFLDSHESV